ncbi:MAG: hypothetical protein ACRD0N_05755, partial [Acidimicrobiales bacterium]
GGVALHLAIGLVARRREGKKVCVEARLLGATVAEGWETMGDLLAGLRPGLVLVDGEEELSTLAAERFPGVPVQRCPWHLARGVYRAARYTDRASHEVSDDSRAQLEALLLAAYRSGDLDAARAAYADLVDDAGGCGAAHLRGAEGEVSTFLTHRRRPPGLRPQGPPRAGHRRGWSGSCGRWTGAPTSACAGRSKACGPSSWSSCSAGTLTARGHRARWPTNPQQCGSVSRLEAGVNTSPRYRMMTGPRAWLQPRTHRPSLSAAFCCLRSRRAA